MTVKLGMRVFWNHGPIPVNTRKIARLAMTVPFGTVMNLGDSGTGGGNVSSVNGQTGDVVLAANDVGADLAGSAQSVSEALQPQITTNTDAVAMLTALLSAMQAAKADVSYVNEQIANLVDSDAQTLATIQAITDALAESEDLLEALDQTVANRVRFDVATQGLTALQKYNARTNIGAEEIGVAAMLINQITAASIGAVTASQLATVATTGSYNDLTNKPSITGILLTGLTTATAAAITATDSIIGALAKLQASIETKADAANTLLLLGNKQNKLPTDGTAGQFLAHDLTFKTPSGGGGGETLTWVDLPALTSNNYASGATDGTDKLQIAKSVDGYIWIRGVVRNTSGSNNSTSFAALPLSHMVYVPSAAIGFNVVTTAQLSNTGSNNEIPGFVSHGYFIPDSTLRSLNRAGGSSGSNFVANGQYFIAPSILGIAKKS